MVKVTVPVSIDLPEQLIDVLADHGDELIEALLKFIDEAKWAKQSEQARLRSEENSRSLDQRRSDLFSTGRLYHRILRNRLAAISDKFGAKSNLAERSKIISGIASEHGHISAYIEVAIKLHRQRLNKKLKTRLSREVLRLYVDGFSNAEIRTVVRKSKSQVGRVITALNQKANEAEISLIELRRRDVQKRLVARLAKTDETIVHWSDISHKRSRAIG